MVTYCLYGNVLLAALMVHPTMQIKQYNQSRYNTERLQTITIVFKRNSIRYTLLFFIKILLFIPTKKYDSVIHKNLFADTNQKSFLLTAGFMLDVYQNILYVGEHCRPIHPPPANLSRSCKKDFSYTLFMFVLFFIPANMHLFKVNN